MVTLRGGALAERAPGPEADSPDPCRRFVCAEGERGGLSVKWPCSGLTVCSPALLQADCVLSTVHMLRAQLPGPQM